MIPRVALAAIVLLAGCVSPTADPDLSDDPRLGATLSPEAAAGTLHFQGCSGEFANLQVPFGNVRGLVPDAFEIDGHTSATALVFFQAVACQRVTANATVFRDVSIVKSAVFVTPTNTSWRTDATDYYVLDLLVSDLTLGQVLKPFWPSDVATFGRSRIAGGSPVESWHVQGERCTVEFEVAGNGDAGTPHSGVYQHWTGDGPFRVIQEDQTFKFIGSPASSTVRVIGDCPTASATGAATAAVAQPYLFDTQWSVVSKPYASEEEIP